MIDSGATVNVISATFVKDNKMEHLLKKGKKLDIAVYGGKKVRTEGTMRVELINPVNRRKVTASVMVVNEKVQPILSCSLCQKLNLIRFNLDQFDSTVSAVECDDLKEQALKNIRKLDIDDSIKGILLEFPDVFEERVGEFEGELTLQTEPGTVPTQQPIRGVPFALKKQFKQELEKMMRDNIIEKLEGPSSWLNSYVIERKRSGKLRICLDPKPLNKALINNYHCQVPSLESITHRFANKNAIKFSKLDIRSGYWHCKLNDKARELTAFGTPQGNYRYKRLPMGITPASKAFQTKMIEQFQGINGVSIIQDDSLVEGFGNNSDQAINNHNQNLRAYLQRCRERNIKINLDKCKFLTEEVTYMGHTLTNTSLKPDKEKIRAIIEFPAPRDLHNLRRFIGMVKYLSKFDHTLTTKCEPLNRLTRKDQIFQWAEVQQRAFEDIKKAIANTPILAYYDLEKPVTIQTERSDVGLGAVLLQNGKPVSYASKVWNDYEKNYAPIEKEMRAVVFGLHKFSDYCYGRHVTIESDHKPLEAISNKPLSEVPKRLLRMVLSIQKFDYKITYKKGSDIIIADALSRAPVEDDNFQFNFSEVNLLEFLAVS